MCSKYVGTCANELRIALKISSSLLKQTCCQSRSVYSFTDSSVSAKLGTCTKKEKKKAWRKMNLNMTWWWMARLICWQQELKRNDTWHRFDERYTKSKKRLLFLYSLCNYCMTHIMGCIFHSDNTLQSSLLSWCHRLRAHDNNTITALKPSCAVCHTFVHFHPLTGAEAL